MPEGTRRVAVITGTRADWGILRPVARALALEPGLEPCLIVAGMHLLPEFGGTSAEVEADGFPIAARVDMILASDTPGGMARSLGLGVIGMAQALETARPDVVLVMGDRGEQFAAALAAAHLNLPVAHIHGGECTVGGNIDESLRWAITRFAHIHLVATRAGADRLRRLGEEPWRIHVVGAPALDVALGTEPWGEERVRRHLGLGPGRPLVVVQHPVTTQAESAAAQMRETMEAVVGCGLEAVVIYPNADAGGRAMIGVLEEYRDRPGIHLHPTLPHPVYLGLLKMAAALVGNSSSGIIEAPSLGLVAVNVGIRQLGRERGANVLDVGCDRKEIAAAIDRALHDGELLRRIRAVPNPYGDGRASARIAGILAGLALGERLIQKRFGSVEGAE
ncbi:MAG: UDP-N-acetylglucosamine 2-epimerase (hydrolyzing) [Acetobacteraceae bacterium]|nr:UDP-N-acetylglucosamine 2-epimerase (hydrolyzing) [Acetobacteraceae bacterium]